MSLHEYVMSQKIAAEDYPFYALIMAALRQADDINMMKLTEAFPEVTIELRKRYNAPGGALNDDDFKFLNTIRRMDEASEQLSVTVDDTTR